MTATPTALFAEIQTVIQGLDLTSISAERKATLQPLIDFIQSKTSAEQPIRLNLICTHNSRRSHLAQIWAQTAAFYYNVNNVCCYSGGTEATAMFPMVAETLTGQGFRINAISQGDNPVYAVKYAANEPPIVAFSKTYSDDFNPEAGFAAVMTCFQADGGCPFIAGAEQRIAITYDDPKALDDSPQQQEKYTQSSLQIATEMCYIFSQIQS